MNASRRSSLLPGQAPFGRSARRLLIPAALLLALAASGCASYSTFATPSNPKAVQAASVHRPTRVSRSDRALLAPQPAPNCEYDRPNDDTVDADLWARLKVEYERHYQRGRDARAQPPATAAGVRPLCVPFQRDYRRRSFGRS